MDETWGSCAIINVKPHDVAKVFSYSICFIYGNGYNTTWIMRCGNFIVAKIIFY